MRLETYNMSRKDSLSISFLYKTLPGRILLRLLIKPAVSKPVGRFMNSGFTRIFIPRFIKNNDIDLSDYKNIKYKSFNDFFIREIKDGARFISEKPEDVISPCDGKLQAFKISSESIFHIKKSAYDTAGLLKDEELAGDYINGTCLIFRLMPNDYHRYCFIDDGELISGKKIKGVLHTVRPIAFKRYAIYTQNSREYAVLMTENFGKVVQMEVGALFIGRITNDLTKTNFKRGEEKGYFEFGGSTIVMLFQENKIKIDDVIFKNTKQNNETVVKLGTVIGSKFLAP